MHTVSPTAGQRQHQREHCWPMLPYRHFWAAPYTLCPAHICVRPPVLPRDEAHEVGKTRRGERGQLAGGGGGRYRVEAGIWEQH